MTTICPICNERLATEGNERVRVCTVCWPAVQTVAAAKVSAMLETLRRMAEQEERETA